MQLLKLSIYILFSICVSFAEHCDPYEQAACDSAQDCEWDATTSDCMPIAQGPPDCVNDCTGFSSMSTQPTHTEWCTWLIGVWDSGSASCMTDCSTEESAKLTTDQSECTTCIAASNCDAMMDDCAQYDQTSCNSAENCHWDGTTSQCVHGGGDDDPPECLLSCGQGFETLSENSTDEEFCDVLTVANTTGCGCSAEDQVLVNCFSYMCGGLEYMEQADAGAHPVCMYDCATVCPDFTATFTGDMCNLVNCISQSGCMSDCTAAEKLPYDGIAYVCNAPTGCEDFFAEGGECSITDDCGVCWNPYCYDPITHATDYNTDSASCTAANKT